MLRANSAAGGKAAASCSSTFRPSVCFLISFFLSNNNCQYSDFEFNILCWMTALLRWHVTQKEDVLST